MDVNLQPGITNDTVLSLVHHCADTLQRIVLSECRNVTESSLVHLLLDCPHLVYVSVCDVTLQGVQLWTSIRNRQESKTFLPNPNLVNMNLNCDARPDLLLAISHLCPNLEIVDLFGNRHLDTASVVYLMKRMFPCLERTDKDRLHTLTTHITPSLLGG